MMKPSARWILQIALVAFCCLASHPVQAGDWPAYLGPKGDGRAEEKGLVEKLDAASPPKTLWKESVGEGFSGPVVKDNKVIVFHRQDGHEVVDCRALQTGELVWSKKYPVKYNDPLGISNGPRATPSVVENCVYTVGVTGITSCWDFKTGKKHWQRDVVKEYEAELGFFGLGGSPLVHGKTLYLLVGGKEKKAGLVALDTATGKPQWTAIADTVSYASPVWQTINGRDYLLCFCRSGLHVVDVEKKKAMAFFPWRARINASVNAANPVVQANQIVITASYQTGTAKLKLTGEKLEKIWTKKQVISSQFNTPILLDGYLYGIDGRQDSHNGELVCVDWKTGEQKWNVADYLTSSLILADGKMISVKETGEVELFRPSPEKFQSLGKVQVLKKNVLATPALSNGVLLLRNEDSMIALDLRK